MRFLLFPTEPSCLLMCELPGCLAGGGWDTNEHFSNFLHWASSYDTRNQRYEHSVTDFHGEETRSQLIGRIMTCDQVSYFDK